MTELSWLRRQAQLSRATACELCGVSMRTWERWESGQGRTPNAVIQLLKLLGGDLSPFGWSGWWLANGELYAPEMPATRHGLRPGDVRAGWWLRWQIHREVSRSMGPGASIDRIQRRQVRTGARLSGARGKVSVKEQAEDAENVGRDGTAEVWGAVASQN